MDVKICLIGKGRVGSCFLELLKEKKELFNKIKFNYKLIAIFEYDGALINDKGIDLDEVLNKGDDFRELSYWKQDVKATDLIPKLDINICIEATPTNPDTGEPDSF